MVKKPLYHFSVRGPQRYAAILLAKSRLDVVKIKKSTSRQAVHSGLAVGLYPTHTEERALVL
jgi:hypothetical protein